MTDYTLKTPTLTGKSEEIKTRAQFVAATLDCPVLNTNVRGLLEIAGLFFKACNSSQITSAFKDSSGEYTWGSYYDACTSLVEVEILFGESPNAWVSPNGNIVYCSWGSHNSICDSLMYLKEEKVEQTWLKITSTRSKSRPIPFQNLRII